jgi:hypothetical protein
VPPDQNLARFFAEDQGLQLIDVRLLSGTPKVRIQRSVPAVVRESDQVPAPSEDSRPEGTGEQDFSWDPTQAYRIGRELLMPKVDAKGELAAPERPNLGVLLSTRGSASFAVTDTSQSAAAQASFSRLQRQIFRRKAPAWEYDKAAELMRQRYAKMLLSNPLRGPQ